MRTGLTKQEKTTDIWFDEKDPLIHIRTHNIDLKNRLTAYAAACKERGSYRSTQSYRPHEMGGTDERLQGASGGNRQV